MFSFSDYDPMVQRSIFSACAIMCLFFVLCLFKWVNYALIVLTLVCSLLMGYLLFVKPFLAKHKLKNKVAEIKPKTPKNEVGKK
jgi:amino acid permease